MKRKYAKPDEFHYYGVGKFETNKVFEVVEKVRESIFDI